MPAAKPKESFKRRRAPALTIDPATGKNRSKYNAKGEHVEGHWCASEAEAERARQLIAMRDAGRIDALQFQPRFKLSVNGQLICHFRPDFQYDVVTDRGAVLRTVVEEVKGVVFADYVLRMKLFVALHPELPFVLIKPGQVKGSRALWIARHCADRLPEQGWTQWQILP